MLREASPTPMPRSTSTRRDHFTPQRGRSPLPQTRQTKPVARQQHDKRRPNSKPPNNFGLLSPKTHLATPSDTRQRLASSSVCGRRLRRRCRSPLHAAAAPSSRFGVRDPSNSFRDKQTAELGTPGWRTRLPGRRSRKRLNHEQPKPRAPCRSRRLATTRQATPQLQPTQQLRPCVAKNASGDTERHTHHPPRHLSPPRCRQNRLRPRRPTKTRWPAWPPLPPGPTCQNQAFSFPPQARRRAARSTPAIKKEERTANDANLRE